MAHETLIVTRSGPVLKITLNRPEARNALSPTMVDELISVFSAAREDAEVRAVFLTGADGNFCAGGDLKGMKERSSAAAGGNHEAITGSNRRFGLLLERMSELPKALIVVVEGAAMGGGVGLIAVADWVIAEGSAQIGTPEVTVGLVPAQIAPFVLQRIGPGEAARLLTFGRRVDAVEAARIGLVHEVASSRADAFEKAVDAVNQCLRCGPEAMAETKVLLRLAQLGSDTHTAVLDQASLMFAASLAGEAGEGIRAFIEKRKPAWAAKIETLT
jgi:isohexenylglutaconyl-CoA hydratase